MVSVVMDEVVDDFLEFVEFFILFSFRFFFYVFMNLLFFYVMLLSM